MLCRRSSETSGQSRIPIEEREPIRYYCLGRVGLARRRFPVRCRGATEPRRLRSFAGALSFGLRWFDVKCATSNALFFEALSRCN